jgi:hypothetical protein
MAKTASTGSGTAASTITREAVPFARILPERGGTYELPREAKKGLALLDDVASLGGALLARTIVEWTTGRNLERRKPRAEALPISVLNRRRRAARAWVESVVAGAVDPETRQAFAHVWMPQLAGTGPDLAACLPMARELVELLRGAIAALVFARPDENLVPQARAMHAAETVLARQLAALEHAARNPS